MLREQLLDAIFEGRNRNADKRRLQEHPLYCKGPKLLVNRNRVLFEDCSFEFYYSLANTVRKDLEFFYSNFFLAEIKFTVAFSRDTS